jgi:hypothetical protein
MCVYIRQYIWRIYRHTQYMPFHFMHISENGSYIYAFTRAPVAAAQERVVRERVLCAYGKLQIRFQARSRCINAFCKRQSCAARRKDGSNICRRRIKSNYMIPSLFRPVQSVSMRRQQIAPQSIKRVIGKHGPIRVHRLQEVYFCKSACIVQVLFGSDAFGNAA